MAEKKENHHYLEYGIGFGLLGGALFAVFVGMFFDFPFIWALGPGLGTLIGIVVGTIMDDKKNGEDV